MITLSFEDYAGPAQKLAKALNTEYAQIKRHRFPDGESLVQIPAKLPKRILICQTFNFPNDKLIELYLAVKTARQQGVEEIILVAPYLCYMRQDKAFEPGQAVSQQVIGPFLGELVDHIITVDPHLHRIQSLNEAIPTQTAISLTAANLLGEFVKSRFQDAVFVGPDEESAQWVSVVAAPGNFEYVVARKERFGDKSVKIHLPDHDYAHKTAVLVDDVISSGHTLAETAKALHNKGSGNIVAICTHALLAPGAEKLLEENHITELISTDSILHSSNQVELAEELAEAVKSLEY